MDTVLWCDLANVKVLKLPTNTFMIEINERLKQYSYSVVHITDLLLYFWGR